MPSAEEVWVSEAHIVPAEDETTSVSTTVETKTYLSKVGADPNSVMRTPKDKASVDYWRNQITHGNAFSVELHLDSMGNVIGADGRHRAVAALLSGHERIHVTVTRKLR